MVPDLIICFTISRDSRVHITLSSYLIQIYVCQCVRWWHYYFYSFTNSSLDVATAWHSGSAIYLHLLSRRISEQTGKKFLWAKFCISFCFTCFYLRGITTLFFFLLLFHSERRGTLFYSSSQFCRNRDGMTTCERKRKWEREKER